jgi:hypothetical protein
MRAREKGAKQLSFGGGRFSLDASAGAGQDRQKRGEIDRIPAR